MTSSEYATQSPFLREGRWFMIDPVMARCHDIFDNEAQALQSKAIVLARMQSREKWAQDCETQRLAEIAKHEALIASFNGWLATDPMRRGKQLATMQRQFLHRGVARTRKEIIDLLIAEGRTLTEDGLQSPEGTFLALNKTERSYAAHALAAICPIAS